MGIAADGGARPSGELVVRKLDPDLLTKAQRAVESLEARVWATARYENNMARIRLGIAIPYDGEREAVTSMDVEAHDGSPFENAFQALIEANLPDLLKTGRLGAAQCLVAAAQKGEV